VRNVLGYGISVINETKVGAILVSIKSS